MGIRTPNYIGFKIIFLTDHIKFSVKNVTFRDQLIRSVTTYKYLGVEITHSLKMTTNFGST